MTVAVNGKINVRGSTHCFFDHLSIRAQGDNWVVVGIQVTNFRGNNGVQVDRFLGTRILGTYKVSNLNGSGRVGTVFLGRSVHRNASGDVRPNSQRNFFITSTGMFRSVTND